MSTTEARAHVCTATTLERYGLWIRSAACSNAALNLLHKKWQKSKESAHKDALLLGWRALQDQAQNEEYQAIAAGLLLHIGVQKAAQHESHEDWRNQLIASGKVASTC